MKKRILVIDDEQQILNSISLYFSEYDVVTASDGKEGLKIFESMKPDLIITDIIMPKVEGIEFILTLKEKNVSVPIIVMSGRTIGREYLDMAIELGAFEKLEKPFKLEELKKLIVKLIE